LDHKLDPLQSVIDHRLASVETALGNRLGSMQATLLVAISETRAQSELTTLRFFSSLGEWVAVLEARNH
jgi:hypothetical protein